VVAAGEVAGPVVGGRPIRWTAASSVYTPPAASTVKLTAAIPAVLQDPVDHRGQWGGEPDDHLPRQKPANTFLRLQRLRDRDPRPIRCCRSPPPTSRRAPGWVARPNQHRGPARAADLPSAASTRRSPSPARPPFAPRRVPGCPAAPRRQTGGAFTCTGYDASVASPNQQLDGLLRIDGRGASEHDHHDRCDGKPPAPR